LRTDLSARLVTRSLKVLGMFDFDEAFLHACRVQDQVTSKPRGREQTGGSDHE
jgi:hypothetical protein